MKVKNLPRLRDKYGNIRTTNQERKITFGERSDDLKISKLSKIKVRSKEGQQLTGGLYRKGRITGSVKNVVVTVRGGYSKSSIYRHKKAGLDADNYYYHSFVMSIESKGDFITQKSILDHIKNSATEFTNLQPAKSGSSPTTAQPRIADITLSINYFQEGDTII